VPKRPGSSEQRIGRRIDGCSLREHKSLEAFDFDFHPTLDKALVLELARLDVVRSHDDVVITGAGHRQASGAHRGGRPAAGPPGRLRGPHPATIGRLSSGRLSTAQR